jgi:hypothetical protein
VIIDPHNTGLFDPEPPTVEGWSPLDWMIFAIGVIGTFGLFYYANGGLPS